jgi:hypothetical protein
VNTSFVVSWLHRLGAGQCEVFTDPAIAAPASTVMTTAARNSQAVLRTVRSFVHSARKA